MRGIVFNAPKDVSVETVPDPTIVESGDAIVRVTKAGICGSDMHIYNQVPESLADDANDDRVLLFNPAAIVLAGHHDDRLEVGRRLGATHTVNTSANGGLEEVIGGLTDGHGPQAVVDAVSSAASMKLCRQTAERTVDGPRAGADSFCAIP